MTGFGSDYSRFYDKIYEKKDYEGECEFLADIFSQYGVKNVLDIACGTGNHIKILNDMSYNVMGIDASPGMIELARNKIFCPLEVKRMENFKISRQFDAVIAMFNSIGYSSDVYKMFENVKKHLVMEGLFVFDFWNKLSANHMQPYREMTYGDIRRLSHSKFVDEDIMEVEHTIYKLEDGEIDWKQPPVHEHHTVQFYDPQDMRTNLEMLGYGVEMFPYMKPELGVTSHDWEVQCVAQKLV